MTKKGIRGLISELKRELLQRDKTDSIFSIRSLSSRSQEPVLLHLECIIPVLSCMKVI